MLSLLVLIVASRFSRINAQTILASLSSDYTLSLANSPYIVNSYVTFSSTAHIIIENGVKIIFVGNKFISVFGSLNCGCNTTNILNDQIKGLSNTLQYIHIVGNESQPTSTGIFINQINSINPPKIQFCNTLFENIQNGITTTSKQYAPYTVHNCEFSSLNNAIHHSTNIINFVHNSYFHDMNSIQSGGGVIYDHCLFHLLGKFSSDTEKAVNIAIRNSEIYGDSTKVCLNINSVAGDPLLAVYNNIISDCKDGIEILSAAISIRNNTITNCTRYGVYAYDTVGAFDISYNSFTNNGVYDILLHNISNVAVVNNAFTPHTQHNTTVYAVDIEHIIVQQNDFTSLKHDYILLFQRVDYVEIINNNFLYNKDKYGAIYANATVNITISRNNFIGNEGRYVMYMENGVDLHMIANNMSNNTVSSHMLFMEEFENVQVKFNKYNSNVNAFGEMLCVQKTNYISIRNNDINRNYMYGGVIGSDMNEIVFIQYNDFNANGGGNLILIKNTANANIGYNMFTNATDLENILYFEYMDVSDVAVVEHNNFMQRNNISAYILCNGGIHTLDSKIFVNLNRFYDINHVKYLISTQEVNINANDNYYDGLQTYEHILAKMNGICEFINVSRLIEDEHNNSNKCSWQYTDCNVINTHCDSDTSIPTQITQYPSISPSISPTQSPTILVTHFIETIPTTTTMHETDVTELSTSQTMAVTAGEGPVRHTSDGDGTFMVIAGSAGITLVFVLFGMILLYVFLKLKKLKNETAHLNKQIRGTDKAKNNHKYNNHDDDLDDLDAIMNAMNLNINLDNLNSINYNPRKSSKLSVISAAAMSKKSSLFSTVSKKSIASLNMNMIHVLDANSSTPRATPRPPPRKSPHNYQKRKNEFEEDLEEKGAIHNGHERDNSSALYMNYSHNPIIEIEGNQTQLESHSNIPYDGNMIMNAINTSMPNIGELSITAKHSNSNLHIKHDSSCNFKLKIDINDINEENINDENDSHLSQLISEEETSESSAFTIKSEEEEHKLSINVVDVADNQKQSHNNLHNGYVGLISPTETITKVGTPPTPHLQSPTSLDPDQILHSLNFRQNLVQQSQPGTPQAAHKLPKPKTKGHWM